MERNQTNISWTGPNTPCVRLKSSGRRIYLTKTELRDLRDAAIEFIEYYNHAFADEYIDDIDIVDDPIDHAYRNIF